jgi:hypothetical protein
MRFPDQKITVVLLSNFSFANLPEMANDLEAIASEAANSQQDTPR